MLLAALSDSSANPALVKIFVFLLFANAVRKTGIFIRNNPAVTNIAAKGVWGVIARKLK